MLLIPQWATYKVRDNNHLYELVTLRFFKSLHNIPSLTLSLSVSLSTNPHLFLFPSFIHFSPPLSLPLFHSLSHSLSLSYSPSSLYHTLSVSIYLSFSLFIDRSIYLSLPFSLSPSLFLADWLLMSHLKDIFEGHKTSCSSILIHHYGQMQSWKEQLVIVNFGEGRRRWMKKMEKNKGWRRRSKRGR